MLTPSESFVDRVSRLMPFNVQISVTILGNLTESTLRNGLKFLQDVHPHLRLSLDRREQAKFIPCKNAIPFRTVNVPKKEFGVLCDEELNTTFFSKVLPLCKATLVKFTDSYTTGLILTLHHIIADGISVNDLVNQFINYCNDQSTAVNDMLYQFSDCALEELFPVAGQGGQLTEDQLKKIDEPFRSISSPLSSQMPVSTKHVSYQFCFNDTLDIIAESRKNKTSVHALVSAAALIALRQHVAEEAGGANFKTIHYLSPINLRQLLAEQFVSDGELGHYVSCFIEKFLINDFLPFWHLAHAVKNALSNFIHSGDAVAYLANQKALLKKFQDPEALVEAFQWKSPVVGVTNIGRFGCERHRDPFYIESRKVLNCMPRVWNHPFAYMVGILTYNNQLQLDVMYVSPTISDEKAERFLRHFRRVLNTIVKQPLLRAII